MRTIIDNTTIHRVFGALEEGTAHKPIRQIDVLALLHFAEHLLFAGEVEVSTFEPQVIHDRTAKAVEFLQRYGITDSGAEGIRLLRISFTETQYGNACDEATPHILADLQVAGSTNLRSMAGKIDKASRPFGAGKSPLLKWLERDWSPQERAEMVSSALDRKAIGAFDYLIANNEPMYTQLREISRSAVGKLAPLALARAIHVLFRIAINEQLGYQRGSIYSPAPQRAKAADRVDHLFRHEIAYRIADEVHRDGREFADKLIEKMNIEEQIPLPIFALHFLRPMKAGSPIKLLEAARQLREDPVVSDIRFWLSEWERSHASGDAKRRGRARQELDSIAQDIRVALHGVPWFSALRGTVAPSPDGVSFDVQPDLSMVSDLLSKAGTTFVRRRKFLALLSKELSTDAQLGADLNRLLRRAIVE